MHISAAPHEQAYNPIWVALAYMPAETEMNGQSTCSQIKRQRVCGCTWVIEGGPLVTAIGAAAPSVDALHILHLMLPAEGPMSLPGHVVLGLGPTACTITCGHALNSWHSPVSSQ